MLLIDATSSFNGSPHMLTQLLCKSLGMPAVPSPYVLCVLCTSTGGLRMRTGILAEIRLSAIQKWNSVYSGSNFRSIK